MTTTIHIDLIQNEDYAADSCAISPAAFSLIFISQEVRNTANGFWHAQGLEISQLIDFGHAEWSEISQLIDFNHWACPKPFTLFLTSCQIKLKNKEFHY